MTPQIKSDFDKIVKNLGTLLQDIKTALPPHATETKHTHELAALFFGVQQLADSLPSPPISQDLLVVAALRVNAFFERNQSFVVDLKTAAPAVATKCTTTQHHALEALNYAYNNPAASSELSFAQLQAAVDTLETEETATTFEPDVNKQLKIANKSLKALQGTGFQPTQEQMRAYTTAWFDVTESLDAKAEKKGQQREHIASLVDIRDGLSAVANRLGALAEGSVGIDIPEF
ncbi:MAG TPA: hypothetical protein VGI19_17405 [Candidatus Cybelea sp.]|jgi:hypothetical protein